jgi:hypothetical protein
MVQLIDANMGCQTATQARRMRTHAHGISVWQLPEARLKLLSSTVFRDVMLQPSRSSISVRSKRSDYLCALQKDGQQLPGKKGIALKPEEWAKICEAAPAISQAHSGRNTRYKLDLGSK